MLLVSFSLLKTYIPFVSQGTTKRKELHGTTSIRALSGAWGAKTDGAIFEAYKFDFSSSITGEFYSPFILLIECKLDDDVAYTEVDLYLLKKTVKVLVSSCGQVEVDSEQVKPDSFYATIMLLDIFIITSSILFDVLDDESKVLSRILF